MAAFDDMLKKAKEKVKGFGRSIEQELKDNVDNIMTALLKLNSSYGHDGVHHIQVEVIKCNLCSKASFRLHIRDPIDHKITLKFSESGWAYIDSKHYCEKCKF